MKKPAEAGVCVFAVKRLESAAMFTVAAFFAIWIIAKATDRAAINESQLNRLHDDDSVRHAVMAGREDIRLIVYLLAAILVGVAIIADRLFWSPS